MAGKLSSSNKVSIVVVIITVIGTIIVALIYTGGIDLRFSHPSPTISILNYQDTNLNSVKKYAPYDVLVSGNVTDAKGSYLYLIVDDGTKKWIQKPLGLIPDNNFSFSGHCFLGDSPTDPLAQDQPYIIYAVITANGSYKEHDDFTGQPYIAISTSINLIRKDIPT